MNKLLEDHRVVYHVPALDKAILSFMNGIRQNVLQPIHDHLDESLIDNITKGNLQCGKIESPRQGHGT